MDSYANTQEHLLAEVERIDLLIRFQVARTRRLHASDEQFQGLYISEEELDRLLARPTGAPRWSLDGDLQTTERVAEELSRLRSRIAAGAVESLRRGVDLRLAQLTRLCGLDDYDLDCLLISLMPELDLRYERIYAYLQDDVTKKRPGLDLVLSLLSPSLESKLDSRSRFSSRSPLLAHHLLELLEEPSQPHPPLLAKYVRVDDRVAAYLLGSDDLDPRIRRYALKVIPEMQFDGLIFDSGLKARFRAFLEHSAPEAQAILYLKGPYGSGKRSIAEALCRERDMALLVVDLGHLLAAGDDFFELALGLLHREALLQTALLYFKNFDAILADDKRVLAETFVRALERMNRLTFLAGDTAWEPMDAHERMVFARVDFPRPAFPERVRLWSTALNGRDKPGSGLDIHSLATKFRFTPGQIRDTVSTAQNLARWREPNAGDVTMQDLYEACRLQSNQKLSVLARKITPKYRWCDIVLPQDRLQQLQEICHYVKYRDRVYGDWGFDRKLSRGKGLGVLFAGPSGTGKTMTAEIIAGQLSLDLYQIDLSTVVSKYIGETEKNLGRIFAEAESSNAILFFDEADALFGKRSEVKDAHDRYANIEVGYLLQRMEEYEGVVILATNFRKNMDEAFVRRLHFTVEFPFPNEANRRRIWEGIWPEDTPRAPDLDLDFMARRFEMTGGNIHNIAVAAAFLAADDGQRVGMSHLLRATQREYQKMGKILLDGEFEQQGHSTLPQ
jgi:ATP-dependent 26S proteasome regulatory subunit